VTPADRPLVVAMLTYRRPDDLARAVPAFRAELDTVPGDTWLLVVDNDPDGSAQGSIAAYDDPRVRYEHEPEPGIAKARNRAVDVARDAGAALLVFVDDDEHPRPGWLVNLLSTYQSTGARVVAGAVVSEYDTAPDGWLAAGRFFDRRRLPTGTPIDVAATNNLLLTLADVGDLRFPEGWGLVGGEDTLFTRTLHRKGVPMVWCDEAVVVDRVPADRLTRSWVLRRAERSGNSAVRVALTLAPGAPHRWWARADGLARGLVRLAGGAAQVLVGRLTGSLTHNARGHRTLARGRGMVSAVFGRVVGEYARPN
jgi:glycosyltransferase involved in cell wall biosynthesis